MHIALFTLALIASPHEMCFIGVGHLRAADETLVLAAWTGEITRVAVPESRRRDGTIPETVREVRAFVFRVIESAGPQRFEANTAILLVPWAYDTSCASVAWTSDEWVPRDRAGVFRFRTMRRHQTGAPIVDLAGWHAPYPFGAFLGPYPPIDLNRRAVEWLTSQEYFELVRAIPLRDHRDTQWTRTVERIFAEGNPRWAVTFPGSQILRMARCGGANSQC